jgi:hypothetical protein
VKNYFAEHRKQFEVQYSKVQANNIKNSSGFVFSTETPATFAEVLAAFPPKSTTDFMISRFFTTCSYDPAFRKLKTRAFIGPS